ncbi:hairy-related 11 [Clarias gariepinus]|uniref:hairy-related 11 n=1 Tax=Clarias gariepinus TaxID=13013 RepID=UPI00234DE132|nr:hairy-related 11 [Clarias gariepinus]
MAKTESMRRKLKPVIEKKRRDRINQNLAVLRTLLFNSTADTRLQNPKLEKAEILDLTVQYIRKNTRDKTVSPTQTNSSKPASAAHTHQCVPDFTSFMGEHKRSLPFSPNNMETLELTWYEVLEVSRPSGNKALIDI